MFAIVALLACHSPSQAAELPASQAVDGFWDHWGDGRAELASYRLEQPRYGEIRQGTAVLVTVTETFTRGQGVKSDGGHDDEFPVVKLNEIRDFQTGIYDYNGMTSVFLPLDGSTHLGLPFKLSFSLQEWCGHAWEQLRVRDEGLERHSFSYFDGEGDRQTTLPAHADGVVADTMPLVVRELAGTLVEPGESRTVHWLPSRLNTRMRHTAGTWTEATVSRGEAPVQVEVPAGAFEAWVWTAKIGSETASWYVEASPPKRLVKWTRSTGESAELLATERMKYWQLHSEGDESRLEDLKLRAGSASPAPTE